MKISHTLARPTESTPLLRGQEELGEDALVYAHYFLSGSGADWYITEYDPIEDIAFGWAEIIPGCGEWGYSSLSELEMISLPMKVRIGNEILVSKFSIKVELDSDWEICTMREVLSKRN